MADKKDNKFVWIIGIIILILLMRSCSTKIEPASDSSQGLSVSFYDRDGNLLKSYNSNQKMATVIESGVTTYNVAYMSFTASVSPSYANTPIRNFKPILVASSTEAVEPVFKSLNHGLEPYGYTTGTIIYGQTSLTTNSMWTTRVASCSLACVSCDVYSSTGITTAIQSGTWYGGTWHMDCVTSGPSYNTLIDVNAFAGVNPDVPKIIPFCVSVSGEINPNNQGWQTSSTKKMCISLDIRPDQTTGDYTLTFIRGT